MGVHYYTNQTIEHLREELCTSSTNDISFLMYVPRTVSDKCSWNRVTGSLGHRGLAEITQFYVWRMQVYERMKAGYGISIVDL